MTTSGTFGHQGFTGTLTMIDPENNLVIVLLTNKIHSGMIPDDACLLLIAVYPLLRPGV